MPFERPNPPQGAWPFRCHKLAACNKIRQQSCGCEAEGDTEKPALVYYFKELGKSPQIEKGKAQQWVFVHLDFLA